MDGRHIACDRCGAEVGAEERHAEIEYVYGDGGGSMTLCRDCFKLVMDTVHGQDAKRQGDAESPTMDERRAVARRLREYKCPVLPSHQTTREAVDAVVGCMGLEEGEEVCTVRHFLDRLADLIDPGEGMDEDGRAALDWVEELGGIDNVRNLAVFGNACGRIVTGLDDGHTTGAREVIDSLSSRLMPEGMSWPRFEDGEPVRFLDDFERYGDENVVSVVTMYSDGSFALDFRAYSKGERVNRPAPKVLDADGVEIRVGDTVWTLRDARELEVIGLYPEQDSCPVKVKERKNGAYTFSGVEPTDLTHRAPVLAADGKPLREGETVYLQDGESFTVDFIRSDGNVAVRELSSGMYLRPERLTHERPESKCRDCAHWQKDPTADNMGVCWFFYHEHEGQDCYAARRADIGACEEFMPRAKALAGRERGE